jgi:hypothetical protein
LFLGGHFAPAKDGQFTLKVGGYFHRFSRPTKGGMANKNN